MKHNVSTFLNQVFLFFVVLSVSTPDLMGQAQTVGQWATLPYTMPINPIHAALLANGKVLVVAGSGNCPPSQSGCPSGQPYGPSNNSGALLWDPTTGAITQFSVSWDMFCNAMALLKDGRALIDGGTIQYDPFYGQPQAAVFDPATNTFSNTQSMVHGRWYPTVVTLGDGRVMTFSGLNETGGTNTAVEFYTVGAGWSTQYPASWTPDLYPRLHLLPNGKVFYSGALTTSKLFDPSTTTWNTNVANTIYGNARTYGTSVLLPLTPANNYDPQVIIMGGHSPATNTTEIIDMGALTPAWQSGPTMSQARIEMNAANISHVVLVRNGTVTHAFGMDQREAEMSFTAGTGALTVTAPPKGNIAPPGYYMLFILNNSGVPSVAKFVQLTPQPDFSVAATPASRTVPPGTGTSYSVTVTPSNGFTGNVTFSVTGLPSGATAGFSPSSVTGSGSSTLSVNTSSSTPTGSYTLTITATNGSNLTHSTTVTLVVADFALSASPSTRTVSRNAKTTYTVTVTALGPFSATVTFSVSGLPARTSASFSPTSVAGAGNTTLTVSSRPKAATGTYPLTITATGGGVIHSTTVNLVIQ